MYRPGPVRNAGAALPRDRADSDPVTATASAFRKGSKQRAGSKTRQSPAKRGGRVPALPYPLGPAAVGRATPETEHCFLAGGSSSSDELSRVRSITSTFFCPPKSSCPRSSQRKGSRLQRKTSDQLRLLKRRRAKHHRLYKRYDPAIYSGLPNSS